MPWTNIMSELSHHLTFKDEEMARDSLSSHQQACAELVKLLSDRKLQYIMEWKCHDARSFSPSPNSQAAISFD
jgi:hypothetical protein